MQLIFIKFVLIVFSNAIVIVLKRIFFSAIKMWRCVLTCMLGI